MKLLVIRHAQAEDASLDQADDSRELTTDGRRAFKRVVRGLRDLDYRFTRVLTSPRVRAVATAELLLRDGAPIVTPLLAQKPRAELLAMISEATGDSEAALGAYLRALELDPTLADAHFNASRLYERRGQKAPALRHLRAYGKLSADQ